MNFYFIGSIDGQYQFWNELKIESKEQNIFINGERVSIKALKNQNNPELLLAKDFDGIDSVIYIAEKNKKTPEILRYIPKNTHIDLYSKELDGTALEFLKQLVCDIQNGILPQANKPKKIKKTKNESSSLLECFSFFNDTDDINQSYHGLNIHTKKLGYKKF